MFKKLLFLLVFSSFCFANVGNIALLRGQADIFRNGKTIKAKNLMQIKNHDKIRTYKHTKMQLRFNDDTIITLGSLTSFSVDEYSKESKDAKAKFSIVKGAFKVITGKIGKLAPKRFNVRTLNGTIGVRGTIFIGEVNKNNTKKDYISCLEGLIVVRSNLEQNEIDIEKGQMIVLGTDGVDDISSLQTDEFSLLQKTSLSDTKLEHKSSFVSSIENNAEEELRYHEKDIYTAYNGDNDSLEPTKADELNFLTHNNAVYTYKGSAIGSIQNQLGTKAVDATAALEINFETPSAALHVFDDKKQNMADFEDSFASTNIDVDKASLSAQKATSSLKGEFKSSWADDFVGKYENTYQDPTASSNDSKIELDLKLKHKQ